MSNDVIQNLIAITHFQIVIHHSRLKLKNLRVHFTTRITDYLVYFDRHILMVELNRI